MDEADLIMRLLYLFSSFSWKQFFIVLVLLLLVFLFLYQNKGILKVMKSKIYGAALKPKKPFEIKDEICPVPGCQAEFERKLDERFTAIQEQSESNFEELKAQVKNISDLLIYVSKEQKINVPAEMILNRK